MFEMVTLMYIVSKAYQRFRFTSLIHTINAVTVLMLYRCQRYCFQQEMVLILLVDVVVTAVKECFKCFIP